MTLAEELRDALETAAGQYGPVTDEQRNEWMALVKRYDDDAPSGNYFVYDSTPVSPEWPALAGPFATEADAYEYANVSHPEDGDGNAVVLQAAGVPGGGRQEQDLGGDRGRSPVVGSEEA